jgi:hypothetical protein
MYYYNIEIKVEPEIFNNTPMYFWCITKNTKNSSSNNGHGWSISIEQAAIDALTYYNKNIDKQL